MQHLGRHTHKLAAPLRIVLFGIAHTEFKPERFNSVHARPLLHEHRRVPRADKWRGNPHEKEQRRNRRLENIGPKGIGL